MRNTNMLAMQAAVDGGWRQNAHPPSASQRHAVAQTEVQESLVQAQVGLVVTKAGTTRVGVRYGCYICAYSLNNAMLLQTRRLPRT
jgi:hypothetical protein